MLFYFCSFNFALLFLLPILTVYYFCIPFLSTSFVLHSFDYTKSAWFFSIATKNAKLTQKNTEKHVLIPCICFQFGIVNLNTFEIIYCRLIECTNLHPIIAQSFSVFFHAKCHFRCTNYRQCLIISGAYYHLMNGNEITLLILSYFCITFRTLKECRAQLVVQKQYRRQYNDLIQFRHQFYINLVEHNGIFVRFQLNVDQIQFNLDEILFRLNFSKELCISTQIRCFKRISTE